MLLWPTHLTRSPGQFLRASCKPMCYLNSIETLRSMFLSILRPSLQSLTHGIVGDDVVHTVSVSNGRESFSRQQRHFLTLPLETSRATWNMCGRARRRCDFCFELITYVSVLTDGTLPLWDSSSSFTPPGSRRRSGGGLLCRVDISLPAFPCLDMEPVLLT